jgi:hypothetical protein
MKNSSIINTKAEETLQRHPKAGQDQLAEPVDNNRELYIYR